MKQTHAVACIGNGRLIAGIQDGNWTQIFGPPYSSPMLMALDWEDGAVWQCFERLSPAVWKHTLSCGEAVDFAAVSHNCLVRRVKSTAPVSMCLRRHEGLARGIDRLVVDPSGKRAYIHIWSGNDVHIRYPMPISQDFMFTVSGDAVLEQTGSDRLRITVCGDAELRLVGGPSYPEAAEQALALEKVSFEQLLESTQMYWEKELAPVRRLALPERLPRREELLRAAEDTAVCILVQQGEEGGVLAAINYHFCYVRDQFGVCRAMLRLGLFDAAARMMRFYCDVFRKTGRIHNAQACGVDGMFHYAENDAAEIPGYLLLQFFMYADATGDTALLDDNLDLLRWLYDTQVSQLVDNMMPFNGDETYIAGWILPRNVLDDGSAEATLLFLLSGRRLSSWLGGDARMDATLDAVERAYASHFIEDGQYYLNDPARRSAKPLPKYRFGVCYNCTRVPYCEGWGWTELTENDNYLCPTCVLHGETLPPHGGRYQLPSTLLMPAWLGSTTAAEAAKAYVQSQQALFAETGTLHTPERGKLVGYDYGLLLYNVVHYGCGDGEALYNKLLDMRDESGVWVEYYISDEPAGARYRPWESGINMEALLYYAGRWTP